MPAANEVELFLAQYAAPIVEEARKLAESRSVKLLNMSADNIEAEVAMLDDFVSAMLNRSNGAWTGEADAEDETTCSIALCAAMMEAEAGVVTEDAVHAPIRLFREIVEERLVRKLSPTEESFISKIESRFDRFTKSGEIHDHEMVRIHPRWPVESYDPLRLWEDAPEDVLTFWNHIAAALSERKLPYPGFLDAITDLESTRARMDAWRRSEDIPRWAECIREFNQRTVPTILEADLRLIITPGEARFQIRATSAEAWHLAEDTEFRTLLDAQQSNTLIAQLPTRLLLESCLRVLRDDAQATLRLDDSSAAAWLATLFAQPELRDRLLTLDEVPFELAPLPLRWSAQEKISHDGRLETITLKLGDVAGSEAPRPLRLLPGTPPLYLSPDTIYKGPPSFFTSTTVPTSVEMPGEALATEDGITFLERLEVPLPSTLASRVRRETFTVEITARCLPRAERSTTEHVSVSAQAVSSDGLMVQNLRSHHWVMQTHERPEADTIHFYDRSVLAKLPQVLDELNASFDLELDAFRTRITRQFPQRFLDWSKSLPPGVTLNADDRLQTILADPLKATVRFELQETGIDWFDLRLVFDIEGVDLKPAEIRRLIAARGGFVRLSDGSWRSVTLELTDAQRATIEGLGIDMDELSDEAHPLHLRQLALQERSGFVTPEMWERLRSRLAKLDVQNKPPVPAELGVTLRPYQVDGFHFLVYLTVNRFGGILADDMGLGKTLQSIAWILWLRNQCRESSTPLTPTLIVCPKSVLDVWAVEFAKAAPELRVHVIREKDTLNLEAIEKSADVLVLNYAQLRGSIESLQTINWLSTILDEGQQIKNPDSKVAKAARQLHSQNRLVLTGTPLENRLLDLWSLLTFSTPGALGDRAYFQKHFDRRKDERAAERLTLRLRPFIMRRTKAQVARDLPPRSEENILCEMTGLQEKLYREYLSEAQHMLLTSTGAEALQKRRFAILQAITRLRQICCHPVLVRPDAGAEESAKLNALMEHLDQLHDEGHKVLVFSQFVTMLNIIRDRLVALERPFHYLTGASRNRAQIVEGFQNDEHAAVFLLSLKAGGSGLNLTAASYVILYDPWWNPAVENQAIDRAHRIGQTQPVMAYRLITKDTIEEKIRKLQMQKNIMSNDVLGDERFTSSLDHRDLAYLFEMGDETPAGEE